MCSGPFILQLLALPPVTNWQALGWIQCTLLCPKCFKTQTFAHVNLHIHLACSRWPQYLPLPKVSYLAALLVPTLPPWNDIFPVLPPPPSCELWENVCLSEASVLLSEPSATPGVGELSSMLLSPGTVVWEQNGEEREAEAQRNGREGRAEDSPRES